MFPTKLTSFLFVVAACARVGASGDFEAPSLLWDGGKQITGTPEFFWELECKRIALEFVPNEKRVVPLARVSSKSGEEDPPSDSREDFTTVMDLADFKAALQDGSLTPADSNAATQAHAQARDVVKGASATRADGKLPDETPGEFAEYHQGALAYKTKHPEQARAIWEALLAKPAAERKYRSVWAAYMMGRCLLDEHEFAKASGFFQQTRQLAKEGYVDSLGLAGESYGWEARCELECGHSESSARLYLNQLATGDPSAVVSLKWFIPDWGESVSGNETKAPGVPEAEAGVETSSSDPGPTVGVPRGAKALANAAASPLLRRLVTAHILACSYYNESFDPNDQGTPQAKWLQALDQAGVKDSQEDAEYIGWVAYSTGKYADAQRWLVKSAGTSAAALWLQAKLSLREGKIAEGTKLLSQALKRFPVPRAKLENSVTEGFYLLPPESASGELGILHLAQADFIQALDAFIAADLWSDAAYIAERCLTEEELLDYTRNQKFASVMQEKFANDDPSFSPDRFRDLVARRMVREDDYKTAREFFAAAKIKRLDDYTTALAMGADGSKPKMQQARALFHAAWIARYEGMELMGTEIGPDNSYQEGEFSAGDLAMQRLTGKEPVIEDVDGGAAPEELGKPLQFALAVTQQEKERLQSTKLVVERRFHYRHVAAGLAWKAAELMPDNTKETADVLNSAEGWLVDRSAKQAERFDRAYQKRCPKIPIGKNDGPWSSEERKLMPAN